MSLAAKTGRALKIMSSVVLFGAIIAFAGTAYFALRSHYPIDHLTIDSPTPISAPISGEGVCAFHVCVEHLRGSTCLGRTFAEGVTLRPPGGEPMPWELRFGSSGLNLLPEDGAKRTAPAGEVVVPTTSERVRARCAADECTWSEHVVRCGSEHELGYVVSDDVVTVESPNGGHDYAMQNMFLFSVALLLVFVGSVLSAIGNRLEPRDSEAEEA